MKRIFFSFLSVLFLSVSIPAFAMMGGGGMGGHMGGSGGWGGQGGSYRMHDAPNYNTPQPERSPGYDSSRQRYRYNREPMTLENAELLVRRYMDSKTTQPYRLKDLQDNGTYYTADIVGAKDGDQERLLIDKETGRIHSLGR